MTTIYFYTTAGCHLCEQAHALLLLVSQQHPVTIKSIEIGDDEALVARFGVYIPVLAFTDGSLLYWPFTREDIEQQL